MSKYKVAIIGTGRMAGLMEDEQPYTNRYSKPYSHFASYAAIEETEVVAVANRSPERMKTFCDRWDFHNTYLDYREDDRGGEARHRQRDHTYVCARGADNLCC